MIVIKLWIDGVHPAPDEYVWCKNVEEAIGLIGDVEEYLGMDTIAFIDFDYNLNGRAEFVNWLKETNRNYQLRAHINYPFGKE
jgi:hypothetical protein